MTTTKFRARNGLAVSAIVAASAFTANADIFGYYNDDTDQVWGVSYMHDFDQRRGTIFGVVGLPNDGAMYCGPTSCLNALAYAAERGYPGLQVGTGNFNWNDDVVYNHISDEIETIGFMMSCHPTNGTTYPNWYIGTDLYIGNNDIDVYMQLASGNQPMRAREIAKFARNSGGLPLVGFGRYNVTNGVLDRDGGHSITPTKFDYSGFVPTFRWRDPSSSDSVFFQSPFAHSELPLFDGFYNNDGDWQFLSRLVIPFNANDQRHRLIDGVMLLAPQQGLTETPDGNLGVKTPNPIDPDYPLISSINIGPGETLLDFEFSLDRSSVVYLVQTTSTGQATGEVRMEELTNAAASGGTVPPDGALNTAEIIQPFGLAPDRFGGIYVGSGASIMRFDPNADAGTLPETAPTPNGQPVLDLAYDDRSDRLYAMTADDAYLYSIEKRTDASGAAVFEFTEIALPTNATGEAYDFQGIASLPGDSLRVASDLDRFLASLATGLEPDEIDAATALSYTGVAVWTSDQLFFIPIDAADGSGVETTGGGSTSVITYTGLELHSVSFDRRGRLFAAVEDPNGTAPGEGGPANIFVQVKNPPASLAGEWTDDASSAFAGTSCGPNFKISRSRTNFQAAKHADWTLDVEPDEQIAAAQTVDCLADTDFNGIVDVTDLLNFLDWWFAGDTKADVNSDLNVDVDDLLNFLQDWFAGC